MASIWSTRPTYLGGFTHRVLYNSVESRDFRTSNSHLLTGFLQLLTTTRTAEVLSLHYNNTALLYFPVVNFLHWGAYTAFLFLMFAILFLWRCLVHTKLSLYVQSYIYFVIKIWNLLTSFIFINFFPWLAHFAEVLKREICPYNLIQVLIAWDKAHTHTHAYT